MGFNTAILMFISKPRQKMSMRAIQTLLICKTKACACVKSVELNLKTWWIIEWVNWHKETFYRQYTVVLWSNLSSIILVGWGFKSRRRQKSFSIIFGFYRLFYLKLSDSTHPVKRWQYEESTITSFGQIRLKRRLPKIDFSYRHQLK